MELNIAWKYFYYVHLFKFVEKQVQSINDVAHFLRLLTHPSPLSSILPNRLMECSHLLAIPPPPQVSDVIYERPLSKYFKLYLSPEFCLDSKILRPGPIFSNSMASSDWWMMTDLFSNISKTFIFSDTFISFT